MYQFKLPDPGEGLVEAEITQWLVSEGDEVRINDILVEIETAKSLVELPSPVSGRVHKLLASEGQTVDVGAPIIEIDDGSATDAPDDPDEEPKHLVGSGPAPEPTTRRRPVAQPADRPATTAEQPATTTAEQLATTTAEQPATTAVGKVLAKPLVRRLARDLGVALQSIRPTGPGGTVSKSDVEAAAGLGRVPEHANRVPIKGVRKATATNVAESIVKHVHVTEFNTIDVSATKALVEVLRARREFAGLHVSPLLIHAKAVCLAMARHPELNASWDAAAGEIVYHDEVNLGIAAATPRGLLVPVIKGADKLSLVELCRAINDLVVTAREGKLQPADYAGGTFSITNVGVFGIDTGTPIINGDESAILAMGAIKRKPWVVGTGDDERIEPRWVTTLALSFDHQLIDGEQGSQFLADISTILSAPELALLF